MRNKKCHESKTRFSWSLWITFRLFCQKLKQTRNGERKRKRMHHKTIIFLRVRAISIFGCSNCFGTRFFPDFRMFGKSSVQRFADSFCLESRSFLENYFQSFWISSHIFSLFPRKTIFELLESRDFSEFRYRLPTIGAPRVTPTLRKGVEASLRAPRQVGLSGAGGVVVVKGRNNALPLKDF